MGSSTAMLSSSRTPERAPTSFQDTSGAVAKPSRFAVGWTTFTAFKKSSMVSMSGSSSELVSLSDGPTASPTGRLASISGSSLWAVAAVSLSTAVTSPSAVVCTPSLMLPSTSPIGSTAYVGEVFASFTAPASGLGSEADSEAGSGAGSETRSMEVSASCCSPAPSAAVSSMATVGGARGAVGTTGRAGRRRSLREPVKIRLMAMDPASLVRLTMSAPT